MIIFLQGGAGERAMSVRNKVRGLRADAAAIIELARTQKKPADVAGLLQYAESLTREADKLDRTLPPTQRDEQPKTGWNNGPSVLISALSHDGQN
jgi:hypothetical protein